jgi:hypothetical protein
MRNNVHDFWAQRLLDQIIALITGEGLGFVAVFDTHASS